MPTPGLAYCAALHTLATLRICQESLQIWLLDRRIDFRSSALARAASSEFCLDCFSPPIAFLLPLISEIHLLFDLAQILIIFAVALSTLLIASWHHAASCSNSPSVHSASRWALSFASSIHSFSAASTSFSIIAAKFHRTTFSWSASSCPSASTSHSLTSWSDQVPWSSASMDHFVIGRFTNIKSMSDSPTWSALVQLCVES